MWMYISSSVTEILLYHQTVLIQNELMQDFALKMILGIVKMQNINFISIIHQLLSVLIRQMVKIYKCGPTTNRHNI